MKRSKLYGTLAHLWPVFSPRADYAKAASYWRDVIRKKLGLGRHRILELGVGGGHHLSYLTRDFEAVAVDLSEPMLRLSRRLNPTVRHHVGDMRTVRLGKRLQVVLIHDSIGYMLTERDLRQTFATAAAHLEPNGIFLTAPDNFRETFRGPRVTHSSNSSGKLETTFIEFEHDPNPNDTTIESIMFFLIGQGRRLRIEQERHSLGLFPMKTWLDLIRQTGFKVERWPYPVHDDGRTSYLLVGRWKGGA